MKKQTTVHVGNPIIRERYGSKRIEYTDKKSIDFYSSFDNLLETLNSWKQEFGSVYSNLSFDDVNDCGCHYECRCGPTYYLQGTRLETDVEYEFRLAQEYKQRQAEKERDEADFARLAAKLGK